MKKPKVHIEEFDDVLFDWASDVHVPDPEGKLLELGTVIRINNQLIALKPLTTDQLNLLEEVFSKALQYERTSRKQSNNNS